MCIYLFERQNKSERERETDIFHQLVHFPKWAQLLAGRGQARARSQALKHMGHFLLFS